MKIMKTKIIEAATLLIGTLVFLTTIQGSIATIPDLEVENHIHPLQKDQFKVFGMGHIDEIKVDAESNAKGIIIGNLSVINTKSQTMGIGYLLLIFDSVENNLFTKKMLPDQFVLINFSGKGIIKEQWIPRNPEWTEFIFIGSAEKLTYS
jgi:hypothetical protein